MRKILLIALLVTVCSTEAFGATIEVDVETVRDPIQTIGLVVTPKGTSQKLETKWERVKPNIIVVSVPVASSESGPDTYVSAIVIDDQGGAAFGNMKPAQPADLQSSFYRIAECPAKKVPLGMEAQLGLIQSLVEVRDTRRKYLQQRITALMTDEVLQRARKLEEGFGLTRAQPLGPTLHPLELNDRFTRLLMAIHNYKDAQAAQQIPAAPAEEAAD